MEGTRDTLLCTVGTSLLGHFARNHAEELAEARANQHWAPLAKLLLSLDPSDRNCGAEINSFQELLNRRKIVPNNLFFFVSDTDDGRALGNLLEAYFAGRDDLDLANAEAVVIDNLQDDRPQDFKVYGLRNLVRKLGDHYRRYGESRVAIDATGGYKAQIAVAVLLGQALAIPVFYKHERFSEIIDFPPLPISFDYDLLGRNATLLHYFERGEAFLRSEIEPLDPKMRALLEEIEEDGEHLYTLGALGTVFLEGFRRRNPVPPNLTPASDEERKPPTYGNDHHRAKGFKEFVEKVWRETPWIRTAHSIDHAGQKGLKRAGFDVKDEGDETFLVGVYREGDFSSRFRLYLTDESQKALLWAADQLNRKYL